MCNYCSGFCLEFRWAKTNEYSKEQMVEHSNLFPALLEF